MHLISNISLYQNMNQYSIKKKDLQSTKEESKNTSELKKYIRKGKYIYEVDGNGKVIQIVGEIKKNSYGKEQFSAVFGNIKFDDLDKKDKEYIRNIKKETATCKTLIEEMQKKSMTKIPGQSFNTNLKIKMKDIMNEYDKPLKF